jgi:hypothetical protein
MDLTDFQMYVLTFLTGEERRQQKNGEVFGRYVGDIGYTSRFRFPTTINELTTSTYPELIPGSINDPDNIIESIEKDVDGLLEKGLLRYEYDPSSPSFTGKQYAGFYVTPKGKAFVSKLFSQLPSLVNDKNKYEDAISKVETGSEAKTYFRKLRDKFVERTQDEIIELIFSSAKVFAPAGVAIILKLVGVT